MERKILDKWTYCSHTHTTYYIMFRENQEIWCISKAIYTNKKISYAMSNEKNPFHIITDSEKLKKIWDELENN